jgi:ATP-dependent RNA helicase RhlB
MNNTSQATDLTFDSLNLNPLLLQGIESAGFTQCTPIQAETLPITLSGQDIAGQAQTGTGKTAAFLVATIQRLLNKPADDKRRVNQPRALILSPTRELAVQIHKDALVLAQHTGLISRVVYGGSGYEQQRNDITEGVDILIGTPGRLIDYFKQHVFDLRECEVLVLDEADRMFDLGFIKDIRYLMRRLPKPEERLSMLFSATMSYRVNELAYEHMNNPQQVSIEPQQVTAEQIKESIYYPANEEKIPLLLALLRDLKPERSIVFVNTKHVGEKVWAFLEGNDYKTAILSGDVPQKKRLHLLEQFQKGELPILVATDVAARGLHIEGVTHVFNYDLPQDAEDYVHRIGRTARAGASGEAISFACEDYAMSLMDIEEYIGHKIPMANMADVDLPTPKPRVKREPKPRDNRPRHQQNRSRNHSGNRRPHKPQKA